MKKSTGIIIVYLLLVMHVIAQNPLKTDLNIPTSVKITAEQDHQNMMDQLHITSLRSGANGSNANAPMLPITMKVKQIHFRIYQTH